MSGTFDALDVRPHFVYTCWDYDGEPLYIGCARNVEERIRMHMQPSTQSQASLLLQAEMAEYEWTAYPTKAEARAAERQLIADLMPLLNKQHNPRYTKSHDMRYVATAGAL